MARRRAARRLLAAGIPARRATGGSRGSIVPPGVRHGLWLEFRQGVDKRHALARFNHGHVVLGIQHAGTGPVARATAAKPGKDVIVGNGFGRAFAPTS
jgi:hypothetical protein